MKKLITIITAFICLFITSCTTKNEGGMSDLARKNLAASEGISKCFETNDFSKLGDYLAEDAIDHSGETGDIKGLDNLKAEYEKMMSGMAEMKSETIKTLADDEYVMSWMRFTGTLKNDMMGMKAGQSFTSSSIEVSKCKDGKVVEHWTMMEPSEVMKMIGGAPPPPTTAVADSTSM